MKTLPNAQIIRCENTAQAAKFVAESGRNDVAALASRTCGALYGLTALAESVQDQGNNYTRFICISKNLEIYPGGPHEPSHGARAQAGRTVSGAVSL